MLTGVFPPPPLPAQHVQIMRSILTKALACAGLIPDPPPVPGEENVDPQSESELVNFFSAPSVRGKPVFRQPVVTDDDSQQSGFDPPPVE